MTRRRTLLGAVAAGVAGALAGCSAPRRGDEATATTDRELPLARLGTPPTICAEPPRPAPGIEAVVDPAFAREWRGHEVGGYGRDGRLPADARVIGLTADGRARAYPLSVLTRHEVVDDAFGGPVVVTFCPLCNSGMVADRRVDGRALTFEVSGLLWRAPGLLAADAEADGTVVAASRGSGGEFRNRGNLVLFDRETGSYWSQVLATAICGPHRGRELRVRPSTVATWAEWRAEHPDTRVLLPPPHSGT